MSQTFTTLLAGKFTHHRKLEKGAYLFHEGDRVSTVYVIDRGLVELSRRQVNGAAIVLQRAGEGAVLAESSLYSADYHCDAIASERSTIFQLPKATFLDLLHEDRQFSEAWAAHLAREVRTARMRCEILSRKTVAERLDGWMAWHGQHLPDKGRWKSVAEQIGVSPEALYRELAKRRKTPAKRSTAKKTSGRASDF